MKCIILAIKEHFSSENFNFISLHFFHSTLRRCVFVVLKSLKDSYFSEVLMIYLHLQFQLHLQSLNAFKHPKFKLSLCSLLCLHL